MSSNQEVDHTSSNLPSPAPSMVLLSGQPAGQPQANSSPAGGGGRVDDEERVGGELGVRVPRCLNTVALYGIVWSYQ